jgi:hypothetical protein
MGDDLFFYWHVMKNTRKSVKSQKVPTEPGTSTVSQWLELTQQATQAKTKEQVGTAF